MAAGAPRAAAKELAVEQALRTSPPEACLG